jgi:hypothetical protein
MTLQSSGSSVPSNYTFAVFHHIPQAAFGWANCHMHTFYVEKLLEEGKVSPFPRDPAPFVSSSHISGPLSLNRLPNPCSAAANGCSR